MIIDAGRRNLLERIDVFLGKLKITLDALLGMTRTLAKEVSDLGILVHAVHPGGVDTGMRFDEDRSILMTPQPIADTVVFLLTIEDSGTVDEIRVRRTAGPPWV